MLVKIALRSVNSYSSFRKPKYQEVPLKAREDTAKREGKCLSIERASEVILLSSLYLRFFSIFWFKQHQWNWFQFVTETRGTKNDPSLWTRSLQRLSFEMRLLSRICVGIKSMYDNRVYVSDVSFPFFIEEGRVNHLRRLRQKESSVYQWVHDFEFE